MPREVLVILPLLALAACSSGSPAGRNGSAPDTLAGPPFSIETLPPDSVAPMAPPHPLAKRPAVRADSVRIEGMWQHDRLTLVRSPQGFAPPFSTYLPAGLRVDFVTSDTDPAVRFMAAFAGRVNPEAYLQVRLYPPGASELLVRSSVDAYLRERDPREEHVRPSGGWPWTVAAWDFDYGEGRANERFIGTIGIARHGNRFLHVLAHYPAEYGDGVGPRFHRILQEWRWEDDGSGLMPD